MGEDRGWAILEELPHVEQTDRIQLCPGNGKRLIQLGQGQVRKLYRGL